ncbi:hypothetical protein MCEKH45_00702 [Methylophilaceae bacterium]
MNTETKPDEYYFVNPDGSESILHVDSFTKALRRSKTPRRIQIIHVDDGLPHKSMKDFIEELEATEKLLGSNLKEKNN